MRLSTLKELQTTQDTVSAFGGYNHNLSIGNSEFYDMQNMTSSMYPLASPRATRGEMEYTHSGNHTPNGLISKDALCYVDGTTLYINSYPVSGLTLLNTDKQLVSMGAYILIFPDKKYVNTKDLTDYGSIEAETTVYGPIVYTLCKVDGTDYDIDIDRDISATEPSSPTNGQLWIDSSATPHVLKQYSSSSAVWTEIATTYVKLTATNLGKDFKTYDGVHISGIKADSLKEFDNKVSILYGATTNSIVIPGFIDVTYTQATSLTVSRKMPKLDFVTESENRLWGCRYGTDIYGNVVNEIYACKLGDFKNWNCFMGISTDSYTASCGTDGAFTGAITHLGYPLFFKENCLHKVYGNYPSNYQIQTTVCRGVQKGAGNSLAIAGEVLYYKSRNGICAYDGSLPSEISSVLGDIHYTDVDSSNEDYLRNGAAAGVLGNKYYISMKSEADSNWHMFVYDTARNLWHKEDNVHAKLFCENRGNLYYIDADTDKVMIVDVISNEYVSWMVESGILGTTTSSYRGTQAFPTHKYVSRINIRMSLANGSKAKMYIQYDSNGRWEEVYSMKGTSLRTFTASVRPKRCDHFRFKIAGSGDMKIYSITKILEKGSDVE